MQDFKNLKVWQMARGLTRRVYQATQDYPKAEEFGLRCQMRRASVSICANLAEGCGRGSDRDFRKFVQTAVASGCELECETILSCDLGFIQEAVQNELLDGLDELKRMLAGLVKRLTATIDAERRRRRNSLRAFQNRPPIAESPSRPARRKPKLTAQS